MKNILMFARTDLQTHNRGVVLNAKKEEKKAEIAIYDTITSFANEYYGGVSAKMIDDEIKKLDADTTELTIRLNSPGGDVFQGITIYNRFIELKKKMKVTCIVDGMAASIASIIAMAGDEIIIPPEAYLMIHKPWTWAAGNANELRDRIDLLDKLEYSMVSIYQKKSGLSRPEIENLLTAETWMDGNDAKDKGFSTKVDVDANTKVEIAASALGLEWFKRAPKVENTMEKRINLQAQAKRKEQRKRIGECLARS